MIKFKKQKSIKPNDLTYDIVNENIDYFLYIFINYNHEDEEGFIEIPIAILEQLYIIALSKETEFDKYLDIYKGYKEYFINEEKVIFKWLSDDFIQSLLINSTTTSLNFDSLSKLGIKCNTLEN